MVQTLVVEMVQKPPRKEKGPANQTVPKKEKEVVAKKIKCKGVHPPLPPTGSKGKTALCEDLKRVGCIGLMDHP